MQGEEEEARVLVLYTGGTIGMKCIDGVYRPEANYLRHAIRDLPLLNDCNYVSTNYAYTEIKPYCLPPLQHLKKRLVYWVVEYDPLLDSSDMTFDDWIKIGKDIQEAYNKYVGFVILHGTDTLAYTACALSFMLENVGKPIVITGAQIPVFEIRSDGRENLIGALIMAAFYDIPEVTVFFNNKLFRGNRTVKIDNSSLEAFESPNVLPIAHMDIDIKVNYDSIFRSSSVAPFVVHDHLCRNVGLLRIFPSISIENIRASLQPPVEGVVLQTFGAGNMPSHRTDIIDELKRAIDRGCIIINCSQCVRGQVDVQYLTGKVLFDIGVIPGSDMTTEAALIKLSYVLSKDCWDLSKKKAMMVENIRGELTVKKPKPLRNLEIVSQIARFLHLNTSHEMEFLRRALLPQLLCHAANSGNVELLNAIRENGANLSAIDYNGRNVLHIAASAGHVDAVKYLLAQGVSFQLRDQWDENALVAAVRTKNKVCIETLQSAGAMLSVNPFRLGVELCLCANNGDMETLNSWLAAGANINQQDYSGKTALHIAVESRNEQLVYYLLDRGADPNKSDYSDLTPLGRAEKLGLQDLVIGMKRRKVQ
uniref:asparaginase n=1 Tax=Elaeophora elaphi TaxID=1147741 RepID=A0A0R3RQ01_9BILA